MRVKVKLLAEELKGWIDRHKPLYVRKEELAKIFKVEDHHIDQALKLLNLQGRVGQADHVVCPDQVYLREGAKCTKKSKCWHPDVYWIRKSIE